MNQDKKKTVMEAIAHISASYTKRELDRKFYDAVIDTHIGKHIKNMSRDKKRALEFILYSISAATVIGTNKDAGAIRSFVNNLISDIPSEFARRILNESDESSKEVLKAALIDISDDDLHQTYEDVRRINDAHEVSKGVDEKIGKLKTNETIFAKLAKRIESCNVKIDEARKRIN